MIQLHTWNHVPIPQGFTESRRVHLISTGNGLEKMAVSAFLNILGQEGLPN
jgi:hypothetical protein